MAFHIFTLTNNKAYSRQNRYSSMMKMAQKGLVNGLSSKLFPSSCLRRRSNLKKAITPFEAWTVRKSSVKGLHTFGCLAIGYVPKPYRLHKFTNPGKWLLFLSMSERHKGWILVDPHTYKETHVRSAKFHQSMIVKWWKLWK